MLDSYFPLWYNIIRRTERESKGKEDKGMMMKDFYKAVEEGKLFWMYKYVRGGCWSAPKLVSADVAMAKSKVVVYSEDGEGHCPYDFEVAE